MQSPRRSLVAGESILRVVNSTNEIIVYGSCNKKKERRETRKREPRMRSVLGGAGTAQCISRYRNSMARPPSVPHCGEEENLTSTLDLTLQVTYRQRRRPTLKESIKKTEEGYSRLGPRGVSSSSSTTTQVTLQVNSGDLEVVRPSGNLVWLRVYYLKHPASDGRTFAHRDLPSFVMKKPSAVRLLECLFSTRPQSYRPGSDAERNAREGLTAVGREGLLELEFGYCTSFVQGQCSFVFRFSSFQGKGTSNCGGGKRALQHTHD